LIFSLSPQKDQMLSDIPYVIRDQYVHIISDLPTAVRYF
jgi:hypothetical protein